VRRTVGGQPSAVTTWQVYGLGGELLAEYVANASATTPQKEYGYRNGQLLITAEAPAPVTNVALATNGGVATASSSYASTATEDDSPATANNGDRTGKVGSIPSVWNSAAPGHTFDDWLQIDFNESKTIGELDVITIQDNWQNPSEPTEAMTFGTYGITSYEAQFWTGTSWQTVSGGSVTGNNKVWRKFTFAAVTTNKVRVLIQASGDGYSRVAELEAWTGGSSAQIQWLVTDQLGTPRMVFDQTGALANVKRHDYLPFGEEIGGPQVALLGGRTPAQGYSAADGLRQKFTLYERDNEISLDYAQARYYATLQGRFTSSDPTLLSVNRFDPQTWNRYSYVLNNPTKLIDPSGLAANSPGGVCAAEFSNCDGQESGSQGERDYEHRVQTTRDGILAQHYIDNGDLGAAQRILDDNSDVGIYQDGILLWGEFGSAFVGGYRSALRETMVAGQDPMTAFRIAGDAFSALGWKSVLKKLAQIRGPDFQVLNVQIVAGTTRFIPRGDDMSTALQGISAGGDAQISYAVGWMIQRQTPTRDQIRNWGSGLDFGTDFFLIGGGGFMFSPQQPKILGVYVGVGAGGGIGASFSYEVK
jgi:RHS repeat-associated protein